MSFSLRPDFGKADCHFPPLPEIRSPAIRSQVFTHRSYYARPTHVFEDHPEDPSPDNEKYEHLGDTVLGLAITNLLMDMFPGLRVGPSTKIRAMVVGNPTLAEISLRYRLPDHLYLHSAQAITLRASTNVQADVFESFIGGLYLDQGLDAVRSWIVRLFGPYALAAYQVARQQHGLPTVPAAFSVDEATGKPKPIFASMSLQHQMGGLAISTPAQISPVIWGNGNGNGVGAVNGTGNAIQNGTTNRYFQPLGGNGLGHGHANAARHPVGGHSFAPSGATSSLQAVAGANATQSYAAPGLGGGLNGASADQHAEMMNQPTIGHLALFNQQLQKFNRSVEWIYSDPIEVSTNTNGISNANGASANGSSANGHGVNGAGINGSMVNGHNGVTLPPDVLLKGSKATPVWYVKVLVDGEYYGKGRGNTKKSARNEAAKEGLKKLGIVV